MSVIVVGSLNIDAVVSAERFPRPGETVIGGELSWLPGGKGLNQAVAAARLGAACAMVGCVGGDAFGAALITCLERNGVDSRAIRRVEERATGAALIVVDASGENSIVVAPGANHSLSDSDLAAVDFGRASICVAQLETPLDVTAEAFSRARSQGARSVLNAAPAAELPADLWRLTDVLVVNVGELALLGGTSLPTKVEEAEGLARSLCERGPREVVVTLGADGVLVVEAQSATHHAGYDVDVVDTTGAGDCFVGALAARLALGDALRGAATFANAAASRAVGRMGAAPAMPDLEEVETALRAPRPVVRTIARAIR